MTITISALLLFVLLVVLWFAVPTSRPALTGICYCLAITFFAVSLFSSAFK